MAYGPSDTPLVTNNVLPGGPVQWQGGEGIFAASGTFTTAKMQFLALDGTTWVDAALATLSAQGSVQFKLHRSQVRAVVTGGAAGLYVTASTIPVSS